MNDSVADKSDSLEPTLFWIILPGEMPMNIFFFWVPVPSQRLDSDGSGRSLVGSMILCFLTLGNLPSLHYCCLKYSSPRRDQTKDMGASSSFSLDSHSCGAGEGCLHVRLSGGCNGRHSHFRHFA